MGILINFAEENNKEISCTRYEIMTVFEFRTERKDMIYSSFIFQLNISIQKLALVLTSYSIIQYWMNQSRNKTDEIEYCRQIWTRRTRKKGEFLLPSDICETKRKKPIFYQSDLIFLLFFSTMTDSVDDKFDDFDLEQVFDDFDEKQSPTSLPKLAPRDSK